MARFLRKGRALIWTSAGAAAAYFWDPDRGRSRRVRAKDQAAARARQAARVLGRRARYVEHTAEGKAQALRYGGPTPPDDDRTLVDKIKSEVLGRPDFAGHQVVVEAADGVVTLRGEVTTDAQLGELEAAVANVPGVREVRNLVHLPGAVAPNKEEALKASGQ